MESVDTAGYTADVADRLWRAYSPFQRGRDTSSDLTNMLAILMLERLIDSAGESEDEAEATRRWARAVEDAQRGASPLTDLRAAMYTASMHARFPGPELLSLESRPLAGDPGSDDVPWVAPFLVALTEHPAPTGTVLHEVGELLIERHVQENPYSVGEYHTPRGVVRLIVDLASPQPGDRILDPACGTGGFLAAAAQHIAASGRVDKGSFEAHAMDHSNTQLAAMNMALHGVIRPKVLPPDPSALFQHRGSGLVDVVLSNPPFNQRIKNGDLLDLPFGPPPTSNANFAWLQLAWTRLSANGMAAILMPPAAAWSTGREAQIRREMVARGAVLAVIALPPNLFRETSIPVHAWVLARDKAHHLPADKRDAVLFIDASGLGTQVPRQPRTLTAAESKRISSRFLEWPLSPPTASDEPGFSRSVTHEEILENGGNLDPRLYAENTRAEPSTAPGLGQLPDELVRRDETASRLLIEVRDIFGAGGPLTADGIEFPRAALRNIVRGGSLLAGPSGSLIRAEDYVGTDGIPVVMPKDLTDTGFNEEHIRYIAQRQAEGLERFRLRRGDIVMARRGELGRCAVAHAEQQGWVCGTGCFVLRLPATLDADYLAAYLRSPMAREWLDSHSTGGMSMKTISLSVLGNLPVVVPDLDVQRAIAESMARLAAAERLLQEQLELMQEIRRTALVGLLQK
ncbi:N-6 DNA methylase [Nocardia sp. NPDC050175]|uniref:N-6 DNA methylase n=1 Tax=Nocardia sp. NPDC050175 TaxID=3364317 RepID=UPI0037A147E8